MTGVQTCALPIWPEDVPLAAARILEDLAQRAGAPPKRLTDAALNRLLAHDWPGNVRELQNVLESAVILTGARDAIDAGQIDTGGAREGGLVADAARLSLAQVEERYIREILRLTGNNRTRAARILGINRKTLLEKRKRYRIH